MPPESIEYICGLGRAAGAPVDSRNAATQTRGVRRLRWLGVGWLIASASAGGAAAASPAEAGPAPLLALWEHPTGASLETAPPRIVIYQDGLIIAQRDGATTDPARANSDVAGQFVEQRLPLAEVNVWYDDILAIARDEELVGRYRIGGAESGRAATFYFQAGAHGLLVTVDGLSANVLTPFGTLRAPAMDEVPARLLRIFQDARRISLAQARPWGPDWIEARIRRASSAKGEAKRWPDDWPRPAASFGAVQPEAAIVLLRGSDFLAEPEFGRSPGARHVVALAGSTATVVFRPVLPREESWRRHIAADVDASRSARSAATRAQLGAEREQVRTALQDRVGAPASGPVAASAIEPAEPFTPILDRPAPKLSPLPPTPDPPNPKSKRTR